MIVEADNPIFKSQFDVVSAFVECGDKYLFLHRLDHKPEGGKWGAPAGKVDPGETKEAAMVRELEEETGIIVAESVLRSAGTIHVIHDDVHFNYHTYFVGLAEKTSVQIRPEESQSFDWFAKNELLGMDLVTDMDMCVKKYL